MNTKAEKLGVDLTGLSKEEANTKLKTAAEAKKLSTAQKVTEKASRLDVDVTGLSNQEAKEKLSVVKAAIKLAKPITTQKK